MRTLLLVTSILLFVLWFIGVFAYGTLNPGDVIHAFLIGAVVLVLIRLIFFKKIV